MKKKKNNPKIKLITKDVEKAVKGRAHLVKVAVTVNGRFGQYQSHRWKNPASAFNILKQDLRKQGIKNPNAVDFIDKETGKKADQDDIIAEYETTYKKDTIQEFVKERYEVISNKMKDTSNSYNPKVKGYKMKDWIYNKISDELVVKHTRDNIEDLIRSGIPVISWVSGVFTPAQIKRETEKAFLVEVDVKHYDNSMGVKEVWIPKGQVEESEDITPAKPPGATGMGGTAFNGYTPEQKGHLGARDMSRIKATINSEEVETLDETIKELIKIENEGQEGAEERYFADPLKYDLLYEFIGEKRVGDTRKMQELITNWERHMIKYAEFGSVFRRYNRVHPTDRAGVEPKAEPTVEPTEVSIFTKQLRNEKRRHELRLERLNKKETKSERQRQSKEELANTIAALDEKLKEQDPEYGTDAAKAVDYNGYLPEILGGLDSKGKWAIQQAIKEGKINALDETSSRLEFISKGRSLFGRDGLDEDALQAYEKDPMRLNLLYSAIGAIKNEDFASAQNLIEDWERKQIQSGDTFYSKYGNTHPLDKDQPIANKDLPRGTPVGEMDWKDGKLILQTSKKYPAWVATITGEHSQYKFDRNFIDRRNFETETGYIKLALTEGVVYNWKEGRLSQKYGYVEDGVLYEITEDQVLDRVYAPPKPPKEVEKLPGGQTVEDPIKKDVYWHRRPSSDKPRRQKPVADNAILQPSNDYPKANNGMEFTETLKKLSHLNVDNFARATMDILGIDAPLEMSNDMVQGRAGRCTINKDGVVKIAISRKNSELSQKNTAICESLHGINYKTDIPIPLNETIASLGAWSASQEIHGEEGRRAGQPPLTYMNYIIRTLPVLKSLPQFKDARTPTDFGKIMFNSMVGGQVDLSTWIDTVTQYKLPKQGLPQRYIDAYYPKDPTQINELLDRTHPKATEYLDAQIEHTGATRLSASSAALNQLIQSLKNGTTTLSKALKTSTYGDVASLLLFLILEDEGIYDILMHV